MVMQGDSSNFVKELKRKGVLMHYLIALKEKKETEVEVSYFWLNRGIFGGSEY